MKFFEAVEIARKTGKSIQANGGGVAYWDGLYLRWEPRETRHNVLLSKYNLDEDWQVIEPPPKEYDFTEAYRMMKEGKWMRPVGNTLEHACRSGEWRCRSSSNYYATCNPYLHWKHIESKWIEVNP